MKLISSEDLERLASGFVVANTPGSLLLWLQRDPTVLRIASHASEDSILDDLYPLLRGPRTEMTVAAAYALLVAIGLKRRESGAFANWPFELSTLVWGRAIWDRIERSAISTQTTVVITGKRDPTVSQYSDSGSVLNLVDQHGQPLRIQRG